jgi:hypothetical protein
MVNLIRTQKFPPIPALLAGFGLVLFASACSSHDTGAAPATAVASTPAGALSTGCFAPPLGETTSRESAPCHPDVQADAAIHGVFQAMAMTLRETPISAMKKSPLRPSDWVPWHLDGMIVDFALATNGVFGVLLGNGTASIKTTWQQTGHPTSPAASTPTASKPSVLHVTARTTATELENQLEPTIRLAATSGAVTNENEFRANLLRYAEKFRLISQALSSVRFASGWHVDGLQLQLSVNALGHVTPVLSPGETVIVFLDWQKSADETPNASDVATNTPAAPANSTLALNVAQFSQLIAAEIPEVLSESLELQKSGFVLDQLQVGIALTAGEKIGVAQTQAQAQGKLNFHRDKHPNGQHVENLGQPAMLSDGQLNLIAPAAEIRAISRAKFRRGLKRALRMATYFADKAAATDTSDWRVTQLEAEFDLSFGGELQLATISGTGQFVLDFDRTTQ